MENKKWENLVRDLKFMHKTLSETLERDVPGSGRPFKEYKMVRNILAAMRAKPICRENPQKKGLYYEYNYSTFYPMLRLYKDGVLILDLPEKDAK